MKKHLILSTLLFSVMFSSTSFAEWTKVENDLKGNTFYVDFERIRKVDGYVHFWDLTDYLKLDERGIFSVKLYKQGDCKLFRFKNLNWIFYKEPMGGGTPKIDNRPDKEWRYPIPNSVSETILKSVCDHVK